MQFVYVNKRIILQTPIHKRINQLFDESLLSGMALSLSPLWWAYTQSAHVSHGTHIDASVVYAVSLVQR